MIDQESCDQVDSATGGQNEKDIQPRALAAIEVALNKGERGCAWAWLIITAERPFDTRYWGSRDEFRRAFNAITTGFLLCKLPGHAIKG